MYNVTEFVSTSEKVVYIDVRSSFEFEKGHIPGAINYPILTNEERVEVGTLYVQGEIDTAKRIGLAYGSAKLQGYFDLLCQLKESHPKHKYIFYCARGGYRSRSIALLLKSLDIPVFFLDGGYKGFRKKVTDYFENGHFPKFVVLHGYTGTGKTTLLKMLKENGAPIIDLEGAANHRGSHLGAIGTNGYQSIQTFENTLYEQIMALDTHWAFIESESRRIGNVSIPKVFFDNIKFGTHVMLNVPVPIRVKRLLSEYTHEENFADELNKNLVKIKPYVAPDVYDSWQVFHKENALEALATSLLKNHYDIQYAKGIEKYEYQKAFNASDLESCTKDLLDYFIPKAPIQLMQQGD